MFRTACSDSRRRGAREEAITLLHPHHTSAKLYFYPEWILNEQIQPEQLVFLPIQWAANLIVHIAAQYRAGHGGPTGFLRIYPD